ncbi:MAG: hypothetical protein RIS67_1039 [Pseudomonadota bacterium]|jgi:L,D-peptidoglycan transpeptidase YkuD (ErfK/YbiS/YcfS/YnhG family)
MRKILLPSLLMLCSPVSGSESLPLQWSSEGTQMVIVTTADWQSPAGRLQTFERQDGLWRSTGQDFPVSIGKNGAGWGLGLHESQDGGPVKVEGDGKAPAGIFRIGLAFGQPASVATSLTYQAMDADDWCIDVNDSPLYNRIVSTRDIGADAIKGSTEPMRRDIHNGDHVYKKGFVIAHNPENRPKGGSCIFAHLWRSTGAATAGCTAMTEPDMDRLLLWLNQNRNPVFVLLPESEYVRLRTQWQLPELTSKN